MNRRTIAIIVLCLCAIQVCRSQELETNGTPLKNRWGFSLGYSANNFKGFGLQAGVEKYFSTTKNFNVIGIGSLQFYTQKEKQNGLELNFRVGQRYTSNLGLFFESYLGVGGAYTTYFSPTIDFITGESITTKTSKWGLKPNLTVGIGYDFKRKSTVPLLVYTRTNIGWLYPDRNLVFQTSPFLELGMIFIPELKRKESY